MLKRYLLHDHSFAKEYESGKEGKEGKGSLGEWKIIADDDALRKTKKGRERTSSLPPVFSVEKDESGKGLAKLVCPFQRLT